MKRVAIAAWVLVAVGLMLCRIYNVHVAYDGPYEGNFILFNDQDKAAHDAVAFAAKTVDCPQVVTVSRYSWENDPHSEYATFSKMTPMQP